MRVLQTSEDRFARIPDFPYETHATEVGDGLRMFHVDEGSGRPILMLHGEPTWSFLYRKMIPVLVDAGFRCLAPDLIGFGRSDKPGDPADYTYARHVGWLTRWTEALELGDLTLVCQDWGSLLGLRLAAENPDRFAALVVANGFLPTGDRGVPAVFKVWQTFARFSPWFPIGRVVQWGSATRLPRSVVDAYDAPFPTRAHQAGARAFPRLVPTRPDDPAAPANRAAWEVLEAWTKPVLTAFGSRDPIFRGADRVLQKKIPGARDQPHTTIRGAGHFIQEDRGAELAGVIAQFVDERVP